VKIPPRKERDLMPILLNSERDLTKDLLPTKEPLIKASPLSLSISRG
jgi:hypothetical protein